MVNITMSKFDRITVNPAIKSGQPCIRGMRLTVYRVIALMASYPTQTELLKEFPELQEEDLTQALEFVESCMLKLKSSNIFAEAQAEVDDDLGEWNKNIGAFVKVESYPLSS
jgi:uncharacterized protein (DUF433 family)